nr:hypothetical protein GCM10020063_060360 [Dactylosporangium thailandense]
MMPIVVPPLPRGFRPPPDTGGHGTRHNHVHQRRCRHTDTAAVNRVRERDTLLMMIRAAESELVSMLDEAGVGPGAVTTAHRSADGGQSTGWAGRQRGTTPSYGSQCAA